MDALARIESHFGVPLPHAYREWVKSGYIASDSGSYLWVFEAEWLPPDEIPTYDLWRKLSLPGLIPFAQNSAGDHWVWNTGQRDNVAEYEVLFCWHDEELADAYAPTFAAWFYRNCLDYAGGGFDMDIESIRAAQENLATWSRHLAELGHPHWAAHLATLSSSQPSQFQNPKLRVPSFGFIKHMEVEDIVAKTFGQRYLDTKVEWGTLK